MSKRICVGFGESQRQTVSLAASAIGLPAIFLIAAHSLTANWIFLLVLSSKRRNNQR